MTGAKLAMLVVIVAEGRPDGGEKLGVVYRPLHEDGPRSSCLGLETDITLPPGDDGLHPGRLESSSDDQVQTIVGAQSELGQQEVGRRAVERVPGLGEGGGGVDVESGAFEQDLHRHQA